ncbi:MAG: SH3 domain-containing protein, partial [Mesorhizobium sp.]
LQPPGRPAPALGARNEIPCARHVGQPMTSCKAGVVHTGDKAEVTVTWPDGGTRVIRFQAGRPAGSNASGEFRYTREGSLNMIRV